MNGFFSHLVSKQTNPVANISPRLKGRFESFRGFQPSSFNEVAEGKESLTPFEEKVIRPDKAGITNSHEAHIAKQPDQAAENPHENDSAIDGALIAQPLILEISNDQINNTAGPAKDSAEPLSTTNAEFVATNIKSFNQQGENATQGDDVSFMPNETISDLKSGEDGQHSFSLQQNIQLTQQLEMNMAVINAFKQLYKNETGDNNITTQPPSTIKVNIGRIDVRAVTQQTPSKEMPRPKAGMSLDDFLKKKNGSN